MVSSLFTFSPPNNHNLKLQYKNNVSNFSYFAYIKIKENKKNLVYVMFFYFYKVFVFKL